MPTIRDKRVTTSPEAQSSPSPRGDQWLIGTSIILIVVSALADAAATLGLVDPIGATPDVLAAGVALAIVGVLRSVLQTDRTHLVPFSPALRFTRIHRSAARGGGRTVPKPAP